MEYKFTEGYINWIKGTRALALLREGLEDVVVKAMRDGYNGYKLSLLQRCKIKEYSCTNCTTSTLIPDHEINSCKYRGRGPCNCSTGTRICPQNGACGKFYDYIIRSHATNAPFWNNCDFQKISQNFWNFAKCFISGYGKDNIECSDDTDPADMLSICLHYRKLRDQFSTEDVLKKARNVRNDILHSGKMELTTDEVNGYIDNLVAVLKEKLCQETDQCENGCIVKLERLKRETFVVSTKASVLAHRDAVKAVVEIIQILNNLANNIQCIDGTGDILDGTGDILAQGDGEQQLTPEKIYERLETLYSIETEHKEQLKKHEDQCEEIKAIINNCSRDISILQDTATTIEKTTTETNKDVKIMQNDMQEIKATLAEIHEYYVSATVPIPGIRTEIISSNIPTAKEKNFQVKLTATNNTISDEEWKKVKLSYKEFTDEMERENGENKREVTDTKHECLAVYVQCWTPKAILKLCEDCVSGRLTEMLKPVERNLRQIEGYEFVTLEVVMYRKDFIKSIDLLVRRLKCCYESLPRTDESIPTKKNGLTPTDIVPLQHAIEVATTGTVERSYVWYMDDVIQFKMSQESNEEDAKTTNMEYTLISNDDSQSEDQEYSSDLMNNNTLDAAAPLEMFSDSKTIGNVSSKGRTQVDTSVANDNIQQGFTSQATTNIKPLYTTDNMTVDVSTSSALEQDSQNSSLQEKKELTNKEEPLNTHTHANVKLLLLNASG